MGAAALYVDRRESTVNESGDYLLRARRRRGRPREHPRRDRRAAERLASTAARDDAELTVFKSLGLAVEDLAAAEHVLRLRRGRGRRLRGRVLIPLDEILRARETIAGVAVRTPLVRLDVDARRARSTSSWRRCSPSTRSRSAAPATRCCRPRDAELAQAASSPRAPGTWRRASPTPRGCAASRRRSSSPRARPRRSSPPSRRFGGQRRLAAVRRLVARARRGALRGRRTASSCTRSTTRG